MNKSLKPCKQPGCAALVTTGYCSEHEQPDATESPFKRLDRKKTAEEINFYRSRPWTRTSKLFRKSNPLCAECKRAGRVVAAEMVHHVIEVPRLIKEGKNPLSWRYLESLCNRCHLGELRAKKSIETPIDISKLFR